VSLLLRQKERYLIVISTTYDTAGHIRSGLHVHLLNCFRLVLCSRGCNVERPHHLFLPMQAMILSGSGGQSLRVWPGICGNARWRLALGVESPGTCKQSTFSFLLDSWVTQPLVFYALGCSYCLIFLPVYSADQFWPLESRLSAD
jgi:hypothetical protein